MSDLIERSAAIEKLKDNLAYMRTFGADRSIDLINELPPAQPFHNIAMNDVLKYIDGMPEDVW